MKPISLISQKTSSIACLWVIIVTSTSGCSDPAVQNIAKQAREAVRSIFSGKPDNSSQKTLARPGLIRNVLLPAHVPISHAKYDLKSGQLSGRVTNTTTNYILEEFTVEIKIYDCTPTCIVVGDRALTISQTVPPGQARDFGSSPIASLPHPNDIPRIRGQSRFAYAVISTEARVLNP